MTDSELRQLIKSNSRIIQSNRETLQGVTQAILHLTEGSQLAQVERAELHATIRSMSGTVDSLGGKVNQLTEHVNARQPR